MNSILSGSEARRRRQLVVAIGDGLRALRAGLSLLNHQVGTRVELKDIGLECLDLLDRHGGLSPTALARRTGLHPATLTGILDRLERAGWITRDRAEDDRRAVVVRPTLHRAGDILRLYAGMNARLNKICADYDEKDLALIGEFLKRVAKAGEDAAAELSTSD